MQRERRGDRVEVALNSATFAYGIASTCVARAGTRSVNARAVAASRA
jgi:hypothetical protein